MKLTSKTLSLNNVVLVYNTDKQGERYVASNHQ